MNSYKIFSKQPLSPHSPIFHLIYSRGRPFENNAITFMIEVLRVWLGFAFIISQPILIQMGNSMPSELQTQAHPLSPLPADPRYDYLSHWKNPNGELFLAREIELPESIGFQNLKKRLQNRQAVPPEASCLYPLDQCYFQHMNSLCSQQERCILTCAKPRNNLQVIFEERRLVGVPFSSDEINLVLSNISISLQSLLQINESYPPLRMNHIVIDNSLSLMDPLLIENDPFGYNSLGQYPAPEQFQEQQAIPSSKQALMLTHLFSLGVIGLQLAHPHLNIKTIYERYHKYGSINNINLHGLNQRVSNVTDSYLRAKIATLTSFNPQNRKNIYKFIEKENIGTQAKQNIVKRMQISQPINQYGAPLSPLVKNTTSVRDANGLRQANQNLTTSPINRHHHLQKPKIQQKCLQKPKVSINFVTKIHHNINNQQNIIPPSKKSLSFNPTPKKQVHIRHQTIIRQNSPLQQQTPLRIKKKHNFSTIKQVSEYDECASTSRVNTFQDLTLNGNYQGDLLDGKRHGKGIFYFIQGSIYEGQWLNDQMHGYGKLYYPNGKLAYQGAWKFSQFSGMGKVYNDEPRISQEAFDFTDFSQLGEEWVYYQGHLEQDQRHGKGYLVLSNGQSLKGEFLWDKIHGKGQFTTVSGSKIHGIWNQSILQRTIAE